MPTRKTTKPEELPLFAHPVTPRRNAEERGHAAGIALFCLPTLTCAALMILARPNDAQNLPKSGKANTSQAARNTSDADADGVAIGPDTDTTHRRPLDYYTSGVRSSMFSAPLPPAPKPVAAKPIVKPPPAPIVPIMPVNPFADWAYTGTVHAGDVTMALLENSKTKEGQYVKIGESFLGAQVTGITDQSVMLSSAGKPAMLAKSDTVTVTPLDKNADFLNGQQPGQPGQPPPGQPGQPGPQMGGMVTLPNGAQMPADRAARRARFMNRRFNGGGGGGFRGGNGGGQ